MYVLKLGDYYLTAADDYALDRDYAVEFETKEEAQDHRAWVETLLQGDAQLRVVRVRGDRRAKGEPETGEYRIMREGESYGLKYVSYGVDGRIDVVEDVDNNALDHFCNAGVLRLRLQDMLACAHKPAIDADTHVEIPEGH